MFTITRTIFGSQVEGMDGPVGTLDDIYFDDRTWGVRHLVVKIGRGLFPRRVLVSPAAVQRTNWGDRRVALQLSCQAVKDSPDMSTDLPVSRQKEIESRLVAWDGYWSTAPAVALSVSGDPHLRSVRSLVGLRIKASDGRMGHIEDFVLEDQAWIVRSLVVNTRNWLPGKSVLIEPSAVQSIEWEDQTVRLALSCDTIRHSPDAVAVTQHSA